MDADRVLIVGAGPVGLIAATHLTDAGIPVLVIESHHELPMDLRASTFHPPTLDMLDRYGVTETCVEQGLICREWQFRDRKEGAIATFDLGRLEGATRHPYRLQCEQWKLTRLLRARLEAGGLGEIRYNLAATALMQDEEGVTLTVAAPDGAREELRGRYLIAADGARSVVRKALGIAFAGETIPEIFLSLSTTHQFEAAVPDLAPIAYISDPDEWLVLLRTPTLWRVLLPTDPALSDAEITAPGHMEARLQTVQANPAGYDVVHKTAYRVHERVAERYVDGRVFLAGDAAHVNNPLGGMGMNGGIHDAVNLATKLAEVWAGAPLALMGRYERQRRKVALDTVQAQTMRNRQMLREKDPAARRAFHDDLRATVADPARHRAYVMRSSMLQSLQDLDQVA